MLDTKIEMFVLPFVEPSGCKMNGLMFSVENMPTQKTIHLSLEALRCHEKKMTTLSNPFEKKKRYIQIHFLVTGLCCVLLYKLLDVTTFLFHIHLMWGFVLPF